jgi:Ppx/GppA phosphatase family
MALALKTVERGSRFQRLPRATRSRLLLFVGMLASCRTGPAQKTDTTPVTPSAPAFVPVPPSCRPEPDVVLPVPVNAHRACVIDVGSRNIKLLVAETPGDDPRGLYPVRTCRTRMGLGEKGKELPAADRLALADLIKNYRALCTRDGGELTGTFATEWARRSSNLPTIVGDIKQGAGVEMETVSQEREGALGYLAATKGQRGRVVFDFGSRSFQVSVWPPGAPAPTMLGLPLGIDEVGERFFDDPAVKDYATGERAFIAAVREGLMAQPEWKASHKRTGKLGKTLVSLGENGDVSLATLGQLWGAKKAGAIDEAGYNNRVAASKARVQPPFGRVMDVIEIAKLRAWRKRLQRDQALFDELRSPQRRKIFGHKMMAFPALVGWLASEFGVERIVLVPDELAMGVLVEASITARDAKVPQKSP